MSDATYVLQPFCTIADGDALANVNTPAFWTQAWWRIMWGDRTLASLTTAMAERIPRNLLADTHARRHQKVVHRESGQVVGYARWIMPKGLEEKWAEARVPEVSEEEKKLAEGKFAKADWRAQVSTGALDQVVSELADKWRPKDKHLYLDYLAVHPDHQRKGIAKLLVQSGITQSLDLDVPIYVLATSAESPKLYTQLGFELLEEVSQSLDQWEKGAIYHVATLIYQPCHKNKGKVVAIS